MPRSGKKSPESSTDAEKRDPRSKVALGFGMHNPATSDVLYSENEREFMLAMEAYKRTARRPFPTWREVFRVLMSLGYVKQAAQIDFLADDVEPVSPQEQE